VWLLGVRVVCGGGGMVVKDVVGCYGEEVVVWYLVD